MTSNFNLPPGCRWQDCEPTGDGETFECRECDRTITLETSFLMGNRRVCEKCFYKEDEE